MVISKNTQLGLQLDTSAIKIELYELIASGLEKKLSHIKEIERKLKSGNPIEINDDDDPEDYKVPESDYSVNSFEEKHGTMLEDLTKSSFGECYLITKSVMYPAAMIKIGDGFTSKTLKDIHIGTYTYLLGNHKMAKFLVIVGGIYGFYWDQDNQVAFIFCLDMDMDEVIFPKEYRNEFSQLMQVMTFVELGDIETVTLEGGRNNGKPKKDGKITNTSEHTIFVVDSSWNKLIISKGGFKVMGHFRLQPYGTDKDKRKLIWIDAFKKLGYTRKPKASIRHE